MALAGFFKRQGSKFSEYVKQVGTDYSTVIRETGEELISTAIIGGFGFALKTNPSYEDVRNELIEKRQRMVLLPNSEHNPTSDKDLTYRSLLFCQDRLHYYNLWFFSLLVKSTNDNKVRIFHSQDVNLKNWPWMEFYENIIDIGLFGKWYRLEKHFKDYDINIEEISKLPSGI